MTDTRRAERFWLAVGAVGFLFVPWYALQGSVFAPGWIPQFATKEAAPAQTIGLDIKEYAIPTNKNVPLPPTVPNLTEFKVINYDFAKYGASDTRKRLLERWEKEIGQATK